MALQARVLDRAAEREVVEAPEPFRADPEDLVDGLVEVAPDAGRADPERFRLEVQDLADRPALPEQAAVRPRAAARDLGLELGDHPEARAAVRGDLLVARDGARDRSQVAAREEVEVEVVRSALGPRPQERTLHRRLEPRPRGRIARE